MNALRTFAPILQRQRGVALIVMLVIIIMGTVAFLVTSLSKVSLSIERNKQSSDLLAQSKEVVVGYMLSGGGSQRPGEMMYPDVLSSSESPPNYDGVSEGGCFDNTAAAASPPYTPLISANLSRMRCIGRLPWKSMGMSINSPTVNDPTGYMPWYAFSRNLIDTNTKINSDLLNTNPYPWLKVYDMNGALLSDRVAFVIIIPGPALPNQSRPVSPNLGNPDQYLDNISFPPGCSPTGTVCTTTYSNFGMNETFVSGEEHRWMPDPANPGKQIEDTTYQFNDKLIYVTIDELMPLIEKRIAREVKSCLDDYALAALNINHKYPWAAQVNDSTIYPPGPGRTGTYDVRFGRLSDTPSTSTNSGVPTPDDLALQNMIVALQTALTQYINGTGTLNNLRNKGDALKDFAQGSPYNQNFSDPARYAGWYADNCLGMICTPTLTTLIATALNAIPGAPDTTMPASWAGIPSCNTLFNVSSYWPDWRDLVFYQVADGYQPGGAGACTLNSTCLTIGGSGNTATGNGSYRAAVIIAGQKLSGQVRPSFTNPPSDYLETAGGNSHQSAPGAVPSVNFTTYRSSDTANYSTVNDLVLCVDGKNNCI